MRSLMICTPREMLLRYSNQRSWIGLFRHKC